MRRFGEKPVELNSLKSAVEFVQFDTRANIDSAITGVAVNRVIMRSIAYNLALRRASAIVGGRQFVLNYYDGWVLRHVLW